MFGMTATLSEVLVFWIMSTAPMLIVCALTAFARSAHLVARSVWLATTRRLLRYFTNPLLPSPNVDQWAWPRSLHHVLDHLLLSLDLLRQTLISSLYC